MRHGADRYVDKVPNKAGALFVAKTGNDGNPGTFAAPFLTVQAAVNVATPGATIYVRAGTYVEHVTIGVAGTAGARITLRNYPGDRFALDGGNNSCLHVQGAYGYWTIYGLYGTSNGNTSYEAGWGLFVEHDYTVESPPGTWTYQDIPSWIVEYCTLDCGVMLHGSNHVIRHNSFDGSGDTAHAIRAAIMFRESVTTGIQVYNNIIASWIGVGIWSMKNVQDPQIYNNIVHDITDDAAGNCCGIALDGEGDQHTGGDVYHNTVYNVVGAAVVGEGITLENALSGPVVDGNTFHNCELAISCINYDSPVDHRATAVNGVFKNNVIYDCGRAIKIEAFKSASWLHNTILDCTEDEAIWLAGSESYLTGHTYYNNVLDGGTGAAAVVFLVPTTLTLISAADYNNWNNGSTKIVTDSSYTNSYYFDNDPTDWQSVGYDAHGITSDPLFTNESTHDLTLQTSSPCKNTGTNAGVTTDRNGTARPQGGGYDMGAYERA